jgi:hypothetical protein
MAKRNIGSAQLGLNHGPGKGDKDRTANVAQFHANMAEVQLSGVPASADPEFCTVSPGRRRKVYGRVASPKLFTGILR